MLLFSFIVAGSFAFGKIIAGDIDPAALTTARFIVAAGVLGLFLGLTGRINHADYRQPWRFFILGALFLLYFILMFEALRLTTALSTSAIFTMMPLAAAAIDRALFKRSSSALVWAALVIGAVGALWVVFKGSWSAFAALSLGKGEVLFFIGTLSHAAYAVFVPRLRRGEPLYATTLGVSIAGAVILILCFWYKIAETNWLDLAILIWGVLIYLAVFATLGTFALLTFAASRLSSAKVTAYTYLTPMWVVLMESALGNGYPALIILLGGIPIAMALWLLFVEPS